MSDLESGEGSPAHEGGFDEAAAADKFTEPVKPKPLAGLHIKTHSDIKDVFLFSSPALYERTLRLILFLSNAYVALLCANYAVVVSATDLLWSLLNQPEWRVCV